METMPAFLSDCHRSNDIDSTTNSLRGVNASANLLPISFDLVDRISADLIDPRDPITYITDCETDKRQDEAELN